MSAPAPSPWPRPAADLWAFECELPLLVGYVHAADDEQACAAARDAAVDEARRLIDEATIAVRRFQT